MDIPFGRVKSARSHYPQSDNRLIKFNTRQYQYQKISIFTIIGNNLKSAIHSRRLQEIRKTLDIRFGRVRSARSHYPQSDNRLIKFNTRQYQYQKQLNSYNNRK